MCPVITIHTIIPPFFTCVCVFECESFASSHRKAQLKAHANLKACNQGEINFAASD